MDHTLEGVISTLAERPGALDESSLQTALSKHHVKINDQSIASVIVLLSSNPLYPGDLIGKVLSNYSDSFDWKKVFNVIKSADFAPKLNWKNPDSLITTSKFLVSASSKSGSEAAKTLGSLWFSSGYHEPGIEVDLLECVTMLPPAVAERDFNNLGLKKVISEDALSGAPEHIRQMATPFLNHPLNRVDIIQFCIDAVIKEDASLNDAKSFFDVHAKQVPEIFFLGSVQIAEPWEPFLERIIINFFELFFAGHVTSPLVFKLLAKANVDFMAKAFVDIFSRDSSLINKILMILADAGVLAEFLHAKNSIFMLELASQADKKNLYLFETYIKDAEKQHGLDFLRLLLDFLEIKVSLDLTQNQQQQAGELPTGTPSTLSLRSVAAALSLVTPVDIPQDRIEQFKSLQLQCLQAYPRLVNFGQGHNAAILARGDTNTFPPEIEREMKMYYQKMYEQQVEIRDIIAMLQKLKESDDSNDQDLFACMVHSLFDEYRFFPEYPVKALATTAVLFGSLVYFHLIDGMPLSIALRFILESLRMPADSNMFRFGFQALYEFRQRLHEFPKYCAILLEIPGLATQQHFYQQIKDIVAGKRIEDADTSIDEPGGAKLSVKYRSISAEINVGQNPQEDPSESISDKVLFIMNNIASSNVATKSRDLAALLEEKYHRWFANYIVRERAMQEPNYHSLYIAMLEELHNHNLEQYCLQITFTAVIQFLDSPDTISSSDKKTLLKNLGQWLGSLLLARNRPILHKNIAFKKLLLEAYNLQQLPVVLPFVCKTLERASASTVFQPPNPWIMGIFMVLAELYQYADLKLNLKFEIEVLCNAFSMDIENVEVSKIIRNQHADEFEQKAAGLTMDMQQLRVNDDPSIINNGVGVAVGGVDNFTSLISQLKLVGTTPFVVHSGFKRFFLLAIDQALREILQPVVERSVTVASITTKELVSKDFALEPDEQKVRIAAQNMVRVLAGSMALVSCKDPFRESLLTHLRALMVSNGYADQDALSEQIAIAVNENIDIICSLVEKTAINKSLAEIELAMSPAYMLRKAHRDSRSTQAFIDPQLLSRYPLQLPEPFSLTPGGLSPQQFSIYENFGNFGVGALLSGEFLEEPAYRNDNAGLGATATSEADRTMMPTQGLHGVQDTQDLPQAHALFEQAMIQIQGSFESLQKLLQESKETSLTQLTPEHPITLLLTDMLALASRGVLKDQIVLKTSQIAVSTLFTVIDTQLGREVFCFLISKLCSLSTTTAKEVVLWLIYSDDVRKYNVPVMITLIKAKLISASQIDVSLAKQVEARQEAAITFAACLIFEAVLGESPCAFRTDFTGCLNAIENLSKESPTNKVAENLLEAMEKSVAAGGSVAGGSGTIQEQMSYIFTEWVHLTQHPCHSDRSYHLFVYQLYKHEILSNSNLACVLIRTSLELAIDDCQKKAAVLGPNAAFPDVYVAADAFSKLVGTIIATSSKMPLQARIEYVKNIFTVICLVLAADHNKRSSIEQFSVRGYFRVFSSILYEVSLLQLGNFHDHLYTLIADIFATLQPLAFPAFSFAWETLISHRLFMPKMMELKDNGGWSNMANLLRLLISFESNYVEGKEFPETISAMYKGTLRIFLVILHDYPEFLIEYHHFLCNIIPNSFVQLRNLVLSAFPSSVQLPDPLSQDLEISNIAEMADPPKFAEDPSQDLQQFGLKKPVDQYLASGGPLRDIIPRLRVASPKKVNALGFDSTVVNVVAMNALVFYVAIQATSQTNNTWNKNTEHVNLLTQLMYAIPEEGRYFLAEAIANHLRYPNSHTRFFISLVLSFFDSTKPEHASVNSNVIMDTRHIITRVLLERIICNRPHPWGLMVTFTELLKKPNYKMWDLPFTKSTPDVERLFVSLYSHIRSSTEKHSSEIEGQETDAPSALKA